MIYAVPGVKAVTELHMLDVPEPPPSNLVTGHTRCGEEMLPDGLWVQVQRKPGDAICRGCRGIKDVQGTLC